VITVYAANQFLRSNYLQMIPLNFYLLYLLVLAAETAADADKLCLFGLNTDNLYPVRLLHCIYCATTI